ncbi:hypothetical protein E4U55_006982 [Claviceps digitariae]|nr:hypothetical protein E4U55_006982 [Claviceps digitariae]
MSPTRHLTKSIALGVLRPRTASCFASSSSSSSPFSSSSSSAGAIALEGRRRPFCVGVCARSYHCAGTISTGLAACRALRPRLESSSSSSSSLGSIALGRSYSAGSGYGSSEGAVPAWRTWSFDEVRKVVDGEGDARSGKVVIVDVREPHELQQTGKIPGAINIPMTVAVPSFHATEADFRDKNGFERPSRDSELLFYCKAGVRAESAAELARQAGWDSVGVYHGSWLDWEHCGGAVEKV